MTASDETFLLDRQFRQMTLGAGLDVYNDTTLFSNIAIGEPLDNGTVGGVEIATAIGNAGGALVVNAGAIIGNPLNIPSVGTSVALSSDFSFSSGTLVAQSSIARTSQTVPAVISSGTYDVTNIVSFTTAFVSALLSIENTATFSCLGTATFNSIACSTGAIAAAGTSQATANAITAQDVVVTSGTGGVRLVNFNNGCECVVRNRVGATITIYPQLGAQIETAGTNVGLTLPNGTDGRFSPFSNTQWYY